MNAIRADSTLSRGDREPEPVAENQRIISLDVLRGFALLGILPMNIQSFSMILAAYVNPTAYGDLHGVNYRVWLLSHILTDMKFMTIFSMLFGAGIFLMTSRIEASGKPSAALHYRRMGWLILFGALHGFLLWCGDILFAYGVCGLFVYLFRKCKPRTLIVIGLLSIVMVPAVWAVGALSFAHLSSDRVQAIRDSWAPSPTLVNQEVTAYRGGWYEEMHTRGAQASQLELNIFAFRLAGLMLTGIALFKLGVFSAAKRYAALYWAVIVVAVFIGIPINLYGVHRDFAHGWDVRYSIFIGQQYNYWASLLVSFGWVGFVMLGSRAAILAGITRSLAAVGRMALSNYIMQTVICTTIFYGYGFGLFGKVDRVEQFGIVAAVWILQLTLSPLWLRYFQFGPLEWLWRSLTYLRSEPFRRSRTGD